MAANLSIIIDDERLQGRGVAQPPPGPAVESAIRFLREAPHITLSAALALLRHFKGQRMRHLVQATLADISIALPWLTPQQHRNIVHFFSRNFDENLA